MAAQHITREVGASGLAIPSTLAGKNTSESYLALKNFSPVALSSTTPTQLPNCPNGIVYITNPLGNDDVVIGGLDGTNDSPYFIPGTNAVRGTRVSAGSGPQPFRVTNASVLQALAARNGDIIELQGFLSGTDFQTPTNDPPVNPLSLVPFVVVSTSPANGDINVLSNAVIEVVFNRAIGGVSVDLADVAIVPSVPTLQVYIDPTNPSQLDLDPTGNNLVLGTTYTVTIEASPPDVQDQNGNTILTPFVFSFSTASVPPPPPPTPNVVSVTPGSNASGVAINTHVIVVMNTPVISGGVTSSNVKLIQVSNSSVVPSTISLGPDNETITIIPSSALAYSTQYKVVVQNLQNLDTVTQVPNPWDGISQGNAGTFTTSALSFTQRYNISQSTSCSGNAPPFGMGGSFSAPSNGLGTGSGCKGTAYGEVASTTNGLTAAPITKIILSAVASTTNGWSNSSNGGTGLLGVQIRSATGILQYTFLTTFAMTGLSQTTYCSGGANEVDAVKVITIEDTSNVYTMVVGDVILITWSGTGDNEAAVSDNISGVYNGATMWNGSSFVAQSGQDVAMTCYSSP